MNFLLDENFPKSAERLLVDLGHQVFDIRGTAQQGISDDALFALAQEQQAILLTTDRDFYHTIPLMHPEHHGIVVIALKQPNRQAILDRLYWLLQQDFVATLQSCVILLRDNTYRIQRS